MKRLLLPIIPIILLLTNISNAETIITGKVVGVADGDTITVLQDYTQYKIRLYGIDCPESSQDFGNKAKKFTSDLVFSKEVRIIQKDIDRYGRIVGMVYVGDVCANEEILKAGLAWVYQRYCKEPFCTEWMDLEEQARDKKIGLWSHPDPVPPWEYRRGSQKASFPTDQISQKIEGKYHGNVRSMVFHQSTCKDFNCKNCVKIFNTREEAIAEGYRPCGGCRP